MYIKIIIDKPPIKNKVKKGVPIKDGRKWYLSFSDQDTYTYLRSSNLDTPNEESKIVVTSKDYKRLVPILFWTSDEFDFIFSRVNREIQPSQ